MVQAPSPAVIESLNQPISQGVLDALHQIKNSVIGHEHRKEAAVKHGLIGPLIKIISSSPHDGETTVSNGDAPLHTRPRTPLQHQARLQSIIILGSLASGGVAFAAPLLRAHALDHLLAVVLAENSDDLITASLKAIRNLFSSFSPSESIDEETLVFEYDFDTQERKDVFGKVLQKLVARPSAHYDSILCDIISSSCDSPAGKLVAVNEGTFEYLLSQLVALQWDISGSQSNRQRANPRSSQSIASLFPALTASLAFSSRHSPTVCLARTNVLIGKLSNGTDTANGEPAEEPSFHQIPETRSISRNRQGTSPHDTVDPTTVKQYSAVAWLVETARSTSGGTRFAVLQLLARIHSILSNAERSQPGNDASKLRQKACCGMLALSAVPLCVKLIQECSEPSATSAELSLRETQNIREQACQTLAILIADNRELQVAAVQAGAVKHIAPLLRRTFDNVSQTKPFWVPPPVTDQDLPDTCRLGPSGLPSEIAHVMKRRCGALQALAALADREDSHRKAIIESGILPRVVDSLKPFPPDNNASISSNLVQFNTTAVILSACEAAQNMSRSVSLLRTSLIDAGVARPIFDLLKYNNVRVKVAATDVCANLILEVSPMREQLTASGVLDTLCEHTLNGPPELKCSSLWALKHAVLDAPVEQKKKTLQSLGFNWLAATIRGSLHGLSQQSADRANGGVTLRSVNAVGDRVDLLNPTNMDVDDSSAPTSVDHDDNEKEPAADGEDGQLLYDEASNTHYHDSSIRSTLMNTNRTAVQSLSSVLDIAASDPTLQAQREDVALQLQGLDFVRNLLNGENCAEMVRYVFDHFGQQRLLDLLTEKLSPTTHISPPPQRQQLLSSHNAGGPVYYPTEIIDAAIHVTIHIANGGALHKEQLIAQRSLLQAMLPHYSHTNTDVRLACVWTVHALTWKEAESDTAARKRRAQDLVTMGVHRAIQNLERDPELSVRDKVKVVLRHFAEA